MPYKLNPLTGKLDYFQTGGLSASFNADASNSGIAETDLYSYSLPANTFANNGDVLLVEFHGIYQNVPTLRVYFAGTTLNLTATLGGGANWNYKLRIIRVSASVARIVASYYDSSLSVDVADYQELTSKDWTIANILKITGQGNVGTGDVTAKIGFVKYEKAA